MFYNRAGENNKKNKCKMNIPYIKEYNENGELVNPLLRTTLHKFPNRRQRRAELATKRFKGNKKGISLTVYNNMKYERTRQVVKQKDGTIKTIEHYLIR
jgi:hypothetical protein